METEATIREEIKNKILQLQRNLEPVIVAGDLNKIGRTTLRSLFKRGIIRETIQSSTMIKTESVNDTISCTNDLKITSAVLKQTILKFQSQIPASNPGKKCPAQEGTAYHKKKQLA